ncbi:unnamed protein product [Orchesella dallaii]|uniref:Uncharacterized protein n=1 Tax=Orchesella dallaii TaxID=48710 RepID=A0ABP1RVY5_9HEXA
MKVIIFLLSLILVTSQIMASPDDSSDDSINLSKEKPDPTPPGPPTDPPVVTPKDMATTPKVLVTSTKSPGGNSNAQSAPNSAVHRTAPMVAVFGTVLVNIGLNLQKSML